MVLLLILIIVAGAFAVAGLAGAPYVPILRHDAATLLELTALKSGQTLIDLGSGDGRLLRAAAAQGIRCVGYEINPFMVLISRIVCWRYRHLITIRLANIWQTDLPAADAIYVFLMPKFMHQLDQYLARQIHRPTRVVSYAFKIPGRTAISKNRNTFVYQYGALDQPGASL